MFRNTATSECKVTVFFWKKRMFCRKSAFFPGFHDKRNTRLASHQSGALLYLPWPLPAGEGFGVRLYFTNIFFPFMMTMPL